ncbi:MAG: cation:proton antiporter subunit C [Deltaproteobacteria bacterium]|nr:cation:proton antiporter subunit C [Deltaproteobacteria bacterium]MCF8120723.1 cation:proton antiporter subunit C [Deltaproteobacteria bacterium]
MSEIISSVVAHYNYWIYIALMMIGLYAVIGKKNLIKKIIGVNIFQTAIILFYVSIGAKKGATIPIIHHGPGGGHHETTASVIEASQYMNPLPHVLMLTAIVVAVATLGVALALAIKVYNQYGTLEEDEILSRIRVR